MAYHPRQDGFPSSTEATSLSGVLLEVHGELRMVVEVDVLKGHAIKLLKLVLELLHCKLPCTQSRLVPKHHHAKTGCPMLENTPRFMVGIVLMISIVLILMGF